MYEHQYSRKLRVVKSDVSIGSVSSNRTKNSKQSESTEKSNVSKGPTFGYIPEKWQNQD